MADGKRGCKAIIAIGFLLRMTVCQGRVKAILLACCHSLHAIEMPGYVCTGVAVVCRYMHSYVAR